jgi:hypothetical protein
MEDFHQNCIMSGLDKALIHIVETAIKDYSEERGHY